jgi:hypothetical protein
MLGFSEAPFGYFPMILIALLSVRPAGKGREKFILTFKTKITITP